MKTKTIEHQYVLDQLQQIAHGLGETFAPFCEVVVHDLTKPDHAILAIHNNLSGREIGDPMTELGKQRSSNPEFPEVVANYPNRLPDGRQAKSTSIGIRDTQGKYVAALCLNVDLTVLGLRRSAKIPCKFLRKCYSPIVAARRKTSGS